MVHEIDAFLRQLDGYIGSHEWFVYFLLGTGMFFTVYLVFPQIRFFKYAIQIVKGKFDKKGDAGDTSHFQSLATALSGTVGTGNIAGVALAIHQGGPAALFWMLVTAMIGMTTKMVEVTLSHKYREKTFDGTFAGGPMYYMKHRLNIRLPKGKVIKTGYWMAGLFSVAVILSSFGTGSLPQINSISNSLWDTFGIDKWITGFILSVLLGFIIVGGIRRIAKVTEKLVPVMAVIYFIGALSVIAFNYQNILPSLSSVFDGILSGSSAWGGFLGASVAFAINRGVNRGLFSNEAGQGSAPIAHAAARASEPVSEGLVALLEPFIDTVIICMLTGMALLTSGVWSEKLSNQFQQTDIVVIEGVYHESCPDEKVLLKDFILGQSDLKKFDGRLTVKDGAISNEVTIIHNRSVAEEVVVTYRKELFSGVLTCNKGRLLLSDDVQLSGFSLIQSAPLTNAAFTRSWFGDFGKVIVSVSILLFAFSTAISWSYYGNRAVIYLFGNKAVKWYGLIYVIGFFVASFVDTTLVWTFSGITIAFMTIPNLVGILLLRKEVKEEIRKFWIEYKLRFPNEKSPNF